MHKPLADLEDRGLLAFQPRPGHGRALDAHLTDQGEELLVALAGPAKARTIMRRACRNVLVSVPVQR